MTRAEHDATVGVSGHRVAILAALAALSSCAHPEAPAPLVELRQIVEAPSMAQGQAAAPDLVAESRRSLRLAEESLERNDAAQARWLATLGILQARIAVAVARQHAAASRREAASIALRHAEEDLARFRAQQTDAEHEIQRLEALAGGAPSREPGSTPDQPRRE